MFTINIGTTDRAVRLIAGVAVIALGVTFSSWFGLIGLVLVGTAFFRWCPAYVPFKVSTCAIENTAE